MTWFYFKFGRRKNVRFFTFLHLVITSNVLLFFIRFCWAANDLICVCAGWHYILLWNKPILALEALSVDFLLSRIKKWNNRILRHSIWCNDSCTLGAKRHIEPFKLYLLIREQKLFQCKRPICTVKPEIDLIIIVMFGRVAPNQFEVRSTT